MRVSLKKMKFKSKLNNVGRSILLTKILSSQIKIISKQNKLLTIFRSVDFDIDWKFKRIKHRQDKKIPLTRESYFNLKKKRL